MKIIVVEKNKKAYVKQIYGTTDALKKEMDSNIEFVRLANDNSVILVVTSNDTTLSDMNRALYRQGSKKVESVICGKFLIVAIDNRENVTSLSQKQIKKYMARFGEPEMFKIRPDGEILAIKPGNIKKERKNNGVTIHSLNTLKKSHEYKTRVGKIGRALDELTDVIPDELMQLLSNYVELEIDFQKYLEKECFKAGMMFAKAERKAKDGD